MPRRPARSIQPPSVMVDGADRARRGHALVVAYDDQRRLDLGDVALEQGDVDRLDLRANRRRHRFPHHLVRRLAAAAERSLDDCVLGEAGLVVGEGGAQRGTLGCLVGARTGAADSLVSFLGLAREPPEILDELSVLGCAVFAHRRCRALDRTQHLGPERRPYGLVRATRRRRRLPIRCAQDRRALRRRNRSARPPAGRGRAAPARRRRRSARNRSRRGWRSSTRTASPAGIPRRRSCASGRSSAAAARS